jgi:class 3 adenylate cyclase
MRGVQEVSGSSLPHGSRETERRRITVMFADIAGFTSLVERGDSEVAYELVTGCLRLLDSIARKHGGAVDKYLGDCVMAVFGLPLAMEDAPRAAVNAAIEMLRQVDEYNRGRRPHPPLGLHIGINTGPAISGDVSGPVVREFAVLGDAVNVASRLKDLAPPGEVYVGEETWRNTRDLFRYEPIAPISAKGKERMVSAYRLQSRQEQIGRRRGEASTSIFSELVGREGLMTELRAALRSACEGRGGIHVLVGEAGIGKTRILDELSRSPEAAGVEWLRGCGVPIVQSVAYQLVADLMRARLEIAEGDGEEAARDKLRLGLEAVLPGAVGEALPIVASILGLPLRPLEQAHVSKLEWDAMERVILRTMTQLLVALSQGRPSVLVLDDLQWADGASLKLLVRLLRLAHEYPLLFLLGTRDGYPDSSGRLLRTLERDQPGGFRRHELRPLPREASRLLLRNLVQHGAVPSGFLARVEEQTRGNPFFMEEVVRSLLETGVLVAGERGMDLVRPHQGVEIPTSVHDIVMARVDRLPHDVRGVLQGASVVGPTVHGEVLESALSGGRNLEAELEHLERSGMLQRSVGLRRWQFVHPLFREVAYDSIVPSRREALHRRVARAVSEHLSESVPGFHAMLAYHLMHGRDLEGAEEHLFRAGEEATKLAAADEALRFFYDAADVYLSRNPDGGDDAKRADLERNIARAHANRGELAEAIEHINLALEALGERVPSSNAVRALHALPGLWAALGMVFRRQASHLPMATDREQRVIELMFARARAQVTTTPAPSFVFDSLDTFRKIAAVDPRSLARVGGMLAGMVGPFTWGGVSLSISRRFLDLAEPLVDPEDVAESIFYQTMRVLHHHQSGSWRDEYEIPPERVEEALRRGLLWDVTNYLLFLAERRMGEGRLSEAASVAEQLEKIGELFQYDLARSTRCYVGLLLEIERGEFRQAASTADAYYTQYQEKLLNLLALGNRAKAELLQGDLHAARATLAESSQILEGERLAPPFHRLPHWRSRLLLAILELRQETGHPRRELAWRARGDAGRALAAARKVAVRAPEVLRLDAERLWRVGRRRRAGRRAAESLATAEKLGLAPERARTHAMLAQVLAEQPSLQVAGWDAAGHRAEAVRLQDTLEPFAWLDAAPPER